MSFGLSRTDILYREKYLLLIRRDELRSGSRCRRKHVNTRFLQLRSNPGAGLILRPGQSISVVRLHKEKSKPILGIVDFARHCLEQTYSAKGSGPFSKSKEDNDEETNDVRSGSLFIRRSRRACPGPAANEQLNGWRRATDEEVSVRSPGWIQRDRSGG